MYVAHTRIYPIANTFEPPRIERQSKKKKKKKERKKERGFYQTVDDTVTSETTQIQLFYYLKN